MDKEDGSEKPLHKCVPAGSTVLRVALITIVYFLAHHLAFFFPDARNVLMAIWPPGGIGLAALLLTPRRLWPAVLASLFVAGNAANVLAGRPLLASAGFMTANVLESFACAWLITHLCGDRIRFARFREVLALLLVATLVNPCTALIGAASATLASHAAFWSFWQTWCVADGLGILLVTPLIITWSDWRSVLRDIRWRRILEGSVFLIVWGTLAYVVFDAERGHSFAFEPYIVNALVVWVALRLGLRAVTTAMAVLAGIVVTSDAVTTGSLFWGGDTATERLLLAQTHLAVTSITGLLLTTAYTGLKMAESVSRETAAVLRESRMLLNSVLEGTTDAVVAKDLAGQFVLVNNAAARFIGKSPGEIIGHDAYFIFGPEEASVISANDRFVLARGETAPFEEIITTADGKRRTFSSIKGPLLDANGKIAGIFGIARDVSDRKRTEEELQRYREHLEDLVGERTTELSLVNESLRREMAERQEIERTLQAHRDQLAHAARVSMLGEMASGLAHEVSQPLGAVALYASTALKQLESADCGKEHVAECIKKLAAQNHRAGEVIVHIRRLATRQASSRCVCDINEITRNAIRLTEHEMIQPAVRMELYLAESPPRVSADAIQIEQVIINLFRNAVEAMRGTPRADAVVRVSTVLGSPECVEVHVADRGTGIPAEIGKELFQPWRTTKPGGMGMGLSISRTIVEAHGGRIWAAARAEGGTVFSFRLPAAREDVLEGN